MLALLIATGLPQPVAARARVMKGVRVVPGRNWSVIEVHLAGSFRYLRHAPAGRGETLQVQLRPEPGQEALDPGQGSELAAWRDPQSAPLLDVEAVPTVAGDLVLNLRFSRVVEFEVSQNGNLDLLRVSVKSQGAELPSAAPPPAPAGEGLARPSAGDPKLDAILDEGRGAMTSGDFSRAILLFTKALDDAPDGPRAPEARELLGLAYQRSGKLAHARAEYEAYLAKWPDDEGSRRVRQRLDALLTAPTGGRARAQRPPAASTTWEHDLSGSTGLYYRHDTLDTDATGSETIGSALEPDLFLTSRHTDGRRTFTTNFSGSYRHEFSDDGSSDSSDAARITSAFVGGKWLRSGYSFRLGRQSSQGMGVLGRFDGVLSSVQLTESFRANLVSGYLVDFTESNRINVERPFYGISADVGPVFGEFDGQLFAIQQRIEGIEDRTAVGSQLRWLGRRGFALALADYDVSYATLNSAMLIGNWRVTDATSLSLLGDVRKSPALTTYNALQGQPVDDFDELLDLFDEDEIRDLAEDRTATSRMVTLGASHQLGERWQIGCDLTLSNLSDTEESAGVAATEGTGNEYYVGLLASASHLLVQGSFTSFNARYGDLFSSRSYAVGAGGRYPVFSKLRVGPQMAVEFRDNDTVEDRWIFRPGLRMDYRWRTVTFEAQGGVELQNGTANEEDSDEREYFVTVGYRYDF
jgi:hypothetical protein